jgi:hypothetical protein
MNKTEKMIEIWTRLGEKKKRRERVKKDILIERKKK